MPRNDPIYSVKAFLRGNQHSRTRNSSVGRIFRELGEIQERLERARQIDGRVSTSEVLGALLAERNGPAGDELTRPACGGFVCGS